MSATGEKKDSWAEVVGWWSNQQTPPSRPCALVAQSPMWLPLSPPTKKVAGPYPCLFLAALLRGEGTWLFSALPCGGSGLGRGQPRAPPVWGTASTSVLVEISHSAFTAIAAAASSPEVPPWVLPLSEERGVAPSYHGAPYGARCHVAMFPSFWPHPSAPRQRT